MSNVQLTNYEINQQAYRKMPPLTDKQLQEKKEEIRKWTWGIGDGPYYKYAGLLCREIYDFTVIHIDESTGAEAAHAAIDVLQSRGEILDIVSHKDDFGESYFCWVRVPMTNEEIDFPVDTKDYDIIRLYVLFDATDWVVEA